MPSFPRNLQIQFFSRAVRRHHDNDNIPMLSRALWGCRSCPANDTPDSTLDCRGKGHQDQGHFIGIKVRWTSLRLFVVSGTCKGQRSEMATCADRMALGSFSAEEEVRISWCGSTKLSTRSASTESINNCLSSQSICEGCHELRHAWSSTPHLEGARSRWLLASADTSRDRKEAATPMQHRVCRKKQSRDGQQQRCLYERVFSLAMKIGIVLSDLRGVLGGDVVDGLLEVALLCKVRLLSRAQRSSLGCSTLLIGSSKTLSIRRNAVLGRLSLAGGAGLARLEGMLGGTWTLPTWLCI
ncbi:hypothetical protein KCU62_g78, partial [Aureobasidium sp. EXF-3399]